MFCQVPLYVDTSLHNATTSHDVEYSHLKCWNANIGTNVEALMSYGTIDREIFT